MYKAQSESLRQQLLDVLADGREAVIPDLETRPVFLLAPRTHLARLYATQIAASARGLVAAVDDRTNEPTLHGAASWTSAEFIARAANYPNAVAIDFSELPVTRAYCAELCRQAGVELRDCVTAQGQLGMVSVYESVADYRTKTLVRMDEFLALAERFSDDHSRATLYANLLFRVTYDRSHMLPTWTAPIEEYFSSYASPATFRLGTKEHFCDCGSYHGPIVSKFLGATSYRYESITAFEPDKENFEVLKGASRLPLRNMRYINKAVSNRRETVRFMETGTMGSYVSTDGTVAVETAKLDEELENLTFLKMDIEGSEIKALEGGAKLIARTRPRIAACTYHYAHDLLGVIDQLDNIVDDYHLRLRQHNGSYFYDLVLYASPVAGVEPTAAVA